MSKIISSKIFQVTSMVTLVGISILALRFVGAAVPFVPQGEPLADVGQPELTNRDISSGAEKVFLGEYNITNWAGNLNCYPISALGAIGISTPCWTGGSASQIALQGASTRKIGTLKDNSVTGTIDASANRIPFSFSNLAAAQSAVINANELAYIRGDQSVMRLLKPTTSF